MNQSTGQATKTKRVRKYLLAATVMAAAALIWSQCSQSLDSALCVQASATTTLQEKSAESQPTPAPPDLIPVYLVGAITEPGIYQVERGSYLYQLIERAGGLSPQADRHAVNLAMRIDQNQQIYLPTAAEIASGLLTFPSGSESQELERIELNQANQEQLDGLPGVGPATAQAILSYRQEHGPFKRVEDLMLVPGIKESRFKALRDKIWVRGCP